MSDTTPIPDLQIRREGQREVRRHVRHYDLTAILSVGYRIRSPRGVQFRQWATSVLHEYMAKGFALDDQRLKNPPGPGVPDYFDELHERIRAHTSRRERSDRVIAPRAALGSSAAALLENSPEALGYALGHVLVVVLPARGGARTTPPTDDKRARFAGFPQPPPTTGARGVPDRDEVKRL